MLTDCAFTGPLVAIIFNLGIEYLLSLLLVNGSERKGRKSQFLQLYQYRLFSWLIHREEWNFQMNDEYSCFISWDSRNDSCNINGAAESCNKRMSFVPEVQQNSCFYPNKKSIFDLFQVSSIYQQKVNSSLSCSMRPF